MENNIIFAPSKLPLERCSSGLRGTPGKRVYAKSVSRVRIPFSPQESHNELNDILLCDFSLKNGSNPEQLNVVGRLNENTYKYIRKDNAEKVRYGLGRVAIHLFLCLMDIGDKNLSPRMFIRLIIIDN